MKVINLYAGPGAGKSTTAAGLFHLLKLKGFKAELIVEYAKELVYEEREKDLDDQLYILAKQYRRLKRLEKHNLDYAITDSPLLLSLVYGKNEPSSFHKLVYDKYGEFQNYEFFIERVKPYAKYGRNQSEDEAREIDTKLMGMLEGRITKIPGDEYAAMMIFEAL